MQRDLNSLTTQAFDILIVGAGIYGAAAARTAAARGLSVALIDRGDFGAGTSANSLKIIHGGLRYLQSMDLIRTRESAVERRRMMRIAPHLVHPLPCLMPTQRHRLLRSRPALWAGLLLNGCLSVDRNHGMDPQKHIPKGSLLSQEALLEALPGLPADNITGAAAWSDAIAMSTERLTLGMVDAAVREGAQAANYVELTGFRIKQNRVTGIVARDRLSGNEFEIRATLTMNNTGPSCDTTLARLGLSTQRALPGLSLAMNIVLRRQLCPTYAAGLSFSDQTAERLLFFVPWREQTIVGTYYRAHEAPHPHVNVTDDDIACFVEDINRAYPPADVSQDDIAFIHAGLLPTRRATHGERDPALLAHYHTIDHAARDNIEGLISVVGVKYTTACDVARRTVARAAKRLNKTLKPDPDPALPGGDIPDFEARMKQHQQDGHPPHLLINYGTMCTDILHLAKETPDWAKPLDKTSPVIGAEVIHAVRHEMAQSLCDVVYRRTDLGSAGTPSDRALKACATLMGAELDWPAPRIKEEIDRVHRVTFPGSEQADITPKAP